MIIENCNNVGNEKAKTVKVLIKNNISYIIDISSKTEMMKQTDPYSLSSK